MLVNARSCDVSADSQRMSREYPQRIRTCKFSAVRRNRTGRAWQYRSVGSAVKSVSVVRAHVCFSAASSDSSAAVTDRLLRFLDVVLVLLTACIWVPLLCVVI